MRRRLSVILTISTLVLLYFSYLLPMQEKRQLIREELFIKTRTLKSYKELIHKGKDVEEELRKLAKNFLEKEKELIAADNNSLGMVRFQEVLRNYADKSSIKVISTKPMNIIKHRYLIGLPVQITATGDVKNVSEFLRLIEQSPYLISIDNLSIRMMNRKRPDQLRVKIGFSGYSETEGPSENMRFSGKDEVKS